MQAAKAQFERDLAGKEDNVEEGRRQLIKQVSHHRTRFFYRPPPLTALGKGKAL